MVELWVNQVSQRPKHMWLMLGFWSCWSHEWQNLHCKWTKATNKNFSRRFVKLLRNQLWYGMQWWLATCCLDSLQEQWSFYRMAVQYNKLVQALQFSSLRPSYYWKVWTLWSIEANTKMWKIVCFRVRYRLQEGSSFCKGHFCNFKEREWDSDRNHDKWPSWGFIWRFRGLLVIQIRSLPPCDWKEFGRTFN